MIVDSSPWPSAAAPTSAAHSIGIPLLLLTFGDLVIDVEIGLVVIGLGQSLGSQLRVDGLLDLCFQDLVSGGAPFDANPLVSGNFENPCPAWSYTSHLEPSQHRKLQVRSQVSSRSY